jgi:hypothetical protein
MPIWAAAILAAAIVAGGTVGFRKLGTRTIEQYEKRLADRLAAGEDRYFEELRSLQAYDPRRRSKRFHAIVELLGAAASFVVLLILFSGGFER